MATSGALSTNNQYVKYTIEIAQNSQSIANNTSNVTVRVRFYRTNTGYTTYGTGTLYCKINGTTYSVGVTPSQAITSSGIVLFTKTLDISHGSDGTKTLACSAWISHNAPLTSSEQGYSLVLTTIPRKSEMSIENGTLGVSQTINVTKKSSAFTHTITYTCGSVSGTICTKSSSTSISWTPLLTLANQNTSGTSVPITLTIATYSGDTWIGSNAYYITCYIPESIKPTVSISVSDSTGYLGTYGGYVQGKSKFKIVVTASGSYGSSISWYSTSADGKGYSGATVVTDVINGSGTLTVSATVTDSRGRTASINTTVTVLPYSTPKITMFSIARCDEAGNVSESGEYLKTLFSAEISELNKKNAFSYKVQHKKSSDSSYAGNAVDVPSGMFAISGATYVFKADTSATYNVILEITDKFSTAKRTGVGPSVKKIISIKGNGEGVAIGKVAELDDCIDTPWYVKSTFTDLALRHVHGTSGKAAYFGVGAGGTNRGVYAVDENNSAGWILYYDDTATNVGMPGKKVVIKGNQVHLNNNTAICSKNPDGETRGLAIINSSNYTVFGYGSYDNSEGAVLYRGNSIEIKSKSTINMTSPSAGLTDRTYGVNKCLWSGAWYMNASQTATLSEAVSAQPTGIVLVWSRYDGTSAVNDDWTYQFVPKYMVSKHGGTGHGIGLFTCAFWTLASKYVVISDTTIKGFYGNVGSGSDNGITYQNSNWVLRYVIGV